MRRPHHRKHRLRSLLLMPLLQGLIPGCGLGHEPASPATPAPTQRTSLTSLPAPVQVVLEPEADTYVWSTNPGTNYGTAHHLVVDPGKAETYLRFNLSSIPAGAQIASVRLQTLAYDGAAYGGDGSVHTHLVPDDTWSETGVNWYNQPAVSGTDLGSWWLWYGSAKPLQVGVNYSPRLRAPVQHALDSDGKISFRLKSPGYKTVYRSREYPDASERPKLIVSYFEPSVLPGPLHAVELSSVADAQVLASSPNSNYGTQMDLSVDPGQAETYLRFDLSRIPAEVQVASIVLVGEICDFGTWWLWNGPGKYSTQVGVNSSPKLVEPVQQALGTDGLISFRLRSPGWRTVYRTREYTNTSVSFPKLLVLYTLPATNP